ncbi:keratin, type I cytoskeletal 10 [Capsella rubella]|uniref:keratin, type I cytoskeletal 10 n=1 Tax=Capsella rubella TaxID=81985 RepID=UPI000CD4CF79|nr:keratin, type I cytoskeletal 10 [Capsella rubella]
MEIQKFMKQMFHVLLLVLAIHAHIRAVVSTPDTFVDSAVHMKPYPTITGTKTSCEIDFPVWRRELRSSGGGRGGGGGSSGRGGNSGKAGSRDRGGGGAGNGGSSNNGGGSSSGGHVVGSGGDCFKHRGLAGTLLSIVLVSFSILLR